MNVTELIVSWADRLRDVSAMGLHFCKNQYDRANYRVVQDISMAMFALAADVPVESLEPLRGPTFSHPTPFSVGDGAVIDREGRVLLIQRADNGKWALPGGALEVGETPADGVEREVLEETGLQVHPMALVGVFDSRLCGALTRHHVYVITFLCQPVDGAPVASPLYTDEVLEMGWFREDSLPEDTHPGAAVRIAEAYRVWRDGCGAYFDGQDEDQGWEPQL